MRASTQCRLCDNFTGRNARKGRFLKVDHAVAEAAPKLVDGDEAAPKRGQRRAFVLWKRDRDAHLDSRHFMHSEIMRSHVLIDWPCQFVPLQRCGSCKVSLALGARP